ncbi:hypothetical protein ACLMJK_004534 [Lecanora helva]
MTTMADVPHLRSAQFSADFPLAHHLRTASTSSSHGDAIGSRHLSTTRESFNNNLPNIRDLVEKQTDFNSQCLQQAMFGAPQETSEVNHVVEEAVYLASPLCLARFPGTFLFQEVQLRALIAALALLDYFQVKALYPAQWDKLKNTDLQKIAFQLKHDSSLVERIRFTGNVYLLQLFSLYLSFIRRGDSALPSVIGPIARMFLASIPVALQQYQSVPDILRGLTELFALWHRPQTKYRALLGLQEYARLASTICREAEDGATNVASIILPALLEKTEALLEFEATSPLPPFGGKWARACFVLGLPPPTMGRGSFLYGLLDVSVQLSALADIRKRPTFVEKLCHLIVTSKVREYRYKALVTQHFKTEESRNAKRTADFPESVSDDTSEIPTTTSGPGSDLIIPVRNSSSVTSSSINPSANDKIFEHDIPQSRIMPSTSFSIPCTGRTFFGLFTRDSYEGIGISSDCRHVMYYNADKISVLPLGDLSSCAKRTRFSRTMTKDKTFTRRESIFDAAMSSRFLIVVTALRTLVVDVTNLNELEPVLHGPWDPSGLAMHQNETDLFLFLGRGYGHSLQNSAGRVDIYTYRLGSSSRRLSFQRTLKLPLQDTPKRLSLNRDGRVLTCVTTVRNQLFVWELNEKFVPLAAPFSYAKNKYVGERHETGITSTSIYTPPSQNAYILCTTAPSSERERNADEWSFIIPLPKINTPHTPRLRPPSNTVYNFGQFAHHRALRAGAVSDTQNVFAVLEDNGRISILPLEAGENGGIRGKGNESAVTVLETRLSGVGGCLRFTPDGERLVAADAKGKVVVTAFAKE